MLLTVGCSHPSSLGTLPLSSLARYLDELDAESVTRQIDQAIAALAEPDDSAADAVVVGRRVLADTSGDW